MLRGASDGLPFMPEMLEHCGRRLRVSRRAEKTCVEIAGAVLDFREFLQNDVVFWRGCDVQETNMADARERAGCSGRAAWLSKVDGDSRRCASEATGAGDCG